MFDEQSVVYLQEMEKRMMEQSAANMRLILENVVTPQLRILAEGQQTILDAITPKSEIEKLQAELDVMRAAIREHERAIQELKKAQ